MKNNFHILRKTKYLKLQNNYIFVDTESNSDKSIKDTEILTFKLGCAIYWNKENNTIIERTYFKTDNFWNDIENQFDKEHRVFLMYAHNTQFDFKMLDGFNQLFKRGWILSNQYIRNKVFILSFKKENYHLHIYDTMNYFQVSLKQLGKNIGLPKLEANFDNIPLKDLIIYCKRDTEIVYKTIRNLVFFLDKHNLSNLKGTAGSLSFNIFRHKFYKPRKNRKDTEIGIHDWKRAIKLERQSYKGGITDCFKVGKQNDIYKMDINSMYPKEMKDKRFPIRLECYLSESSLKQQNLFKMYHKLKSKYGFIMDVMISLPKDNAYILNRFKDKSIFAYGTFRTTLCTPELAFVEKYGKIHHIYELTFYSMSKIFNNFISFFNALKEKYAKENNESNRKFCKLIMNTNYGKWSQKNIIYEKVNVNHKYFKKYSAFIIDLVKQKEKEIHSNNTMVYFGCLIDKFELYLINNELYFLKQTTENAKESFVAISSFITSYSRMTLIKFLRIAKRENTSYIDTDSLFVNQEGYNNLKINNCIDTFELGKLKCEGFGKAEFFAPKFYDFNDKRKCKGIKKHSKLIFENTIKAIYQIEHWQKYKTDLRKGTLSKQIIETSKKEMSKVYNKGKIDKYNNVFPYSVKEIIAMC